jgi:hypothetical protein
VHFTSLSAAGLGQAEALVRRRFCFAASIGSISIFGRTARKASVNIDGQLMIRSLRDAREYLQEFFAWRNDSYGIFTSALNKPLNS